MSVSPIRARSAMVAVVATNARDIAKCWQAPAPLASPPGGESVTVNGITITLTDAARFAPVMTFFPDEEFFPVSVDFFVGHSRVINRTGATVIARPTLDDVALLGDSLARQLVANRSARSAIIASHALAIADANAVRGMPLVGRRVTAPMYVVPQVDPDRSFVDLTYHQLYPWNGAETARAVTSVPPLDFEAIIPQISEHFGDLETVTVRVDASLSRVIHVRFEAHGDSHFAHPINTDTVALGQREHVLGRVAFHAHATYNGREAELPRRRNLSFSERRRQLGRFFVESEPMGALGRLDTVDKVALWPLESADMAYWQPFDIVGGAEVPNGQLVFVGIDDATQQSINDQRWVLFPCRWGQHSDDYFLAAQPVPSDPCTAAEAAQLTNWLFPGVAHSGDGPIGLFDRSSAKTQTPMRASTALGLVWSGDAYAGLTNAASTAVPVAFDGKLLVFYTGRSATIQWIEYDAATKTWSSERAADARSSAPPAAVVLRRGSNAPSLLVVYVDADTQQVLWTEASLLNASPAIDGWKTASAIAGLVGVGQPALAVLGGGDSVLCVVRSPADSSSVWVARWRDGAWSVLGAAASPAGAVRSASAVALVSLDETLRCVGVGLDGRLFISGIDSGSPTVWSTPMLIPQDAAVNVTPGAPLAAPAAAVFNSRLLVGRINARGEAEGFAWDSVPKAWDGPAAIPAYAGRSTAPAFAVFSGVLVSVAPGRENPVDLFWATAHTT
jgi:hypothetical protein